MLAVRMARQYLRLLHLGLQALLPANKKTYRKQPPKMSSLGGRYERLLDHLAGLNLLKFR